MSSRARYTPPIFIHAHSIRTEYVKAAILIADCAYETIKIIHDGSLDADCIVYSFILANVPFELAIPRFVGGENRHAIKYAEWIAHWHDLPFTHYDFDFQKFLLVDAPHWANSMGCVEPTVALTLAMCERMDGHPITGKSPFLCRPTVMSLWPMQAIVEQDCDFDDQQWAFRTNDQEHLVDFYLGLVDQFGIADFHTFTTPQIMSYVADPLVKAMMAPDSGKINNISSRAAIYAKHFPIDLRQDVNGFEHVQADLETCRQRLIEQYSPPRVFYTDAAKAEELKSEAVIKGF